MSDLEEIEVAVNKYLDGQYEGDADKIGSVFHSTCALTQVTNGTLVILPRDEWFREMRNSASPKDLGLARDDHVLGIDVVSPVMAYVKVKCAIPPRYFTDQLNFLKVDGRWQIVQKVFMTEHRNE